jgi:protein O-GlcNAc transferase
MQGTTSAEFEKAVALFRAGNAAAAAQTCKVLLRQNNRNIDALYFLALMEMHQRHNDEAERLFAKATVLAPGAAEIWANRGNNLITLGKSDHALEAFDRALALEPAFPEVLYNRAKLLEGVGRLEEALANYDRCAALMPKFADALNNRGVVLAKLGQYDEALASYDRCLAITPDATDTLNNRGNLLTTLERHDEALKSYDQSLSLAPNDPTTLNNRGSLLGTLKRYDEALANFDRALAVDPNSAPAWQGRGSAAERTKQFGDAFAAYDKAWAIDPTLKYIEGYRLHAKLHLCDWTNFESECAHLVANVNRGIPAAVPLALIGIPSSPADQLKCARTHVADRVAPSSKPIQGAPHDRDRITVAYLSADFRDHAVSYLLAGLFEKHDRARFRTIAISFGPDTSSRMRTRLTDAFETFIDVGDLSNEKVAELLRTHEVDIAVDLMGFTRDFRAGILALRPAPIQVSYLGFAGTMGADFIDYMIADRIVIPPDQQQFYAEKIAYVPDSFQANDDKRMIGPDMSRAAAGLPDDGFVFCCFNQNFKILPQMFHIWMRLLRQIDGSVVWIQEGDPIAARNLRAEAERRGIAADRIVLAPKVPTYEDYLARFRLADLFLDTLPYNAHTTASDALWAGVPVVTCLGSTFASRVAASLLHAIGLPELVAASLADYEALALRLGRQPELLGAVKTKLAAHRNTHALFDTDRFRRHIEAAYATMNERHLRGEPPASFVVDDIHGFTQG